MIFRYFPRGLDLLKINIVVLMFLPIFTGKPNFHEVKSCTDIKLKEIPLDVFQKCSENKSAIHCLPDENNNLGLSCFQATWISKGKCPSYNSYQGNMDEKACSTDYNGECPNDLYKSPLSVRFTGCYIKELIPPPTTTPSMTTETMKTKTPTTTLTGSTINVSVINKKGRETNQTGVCEPKKDWMIVFLVFFFLAVALIAVDCAVYKRIRRGKCKQILRKGDSRQQKIDAETSNPMVKKNDPECNGSVHQK